MPVKFENFSHSFQIKGKPVFAPSDLGRRVGEDVKARVEQSHTFPEFYYHLREGGHVAALHAHRGNRFFAYVDIERFFYSIGRNRVVRSLREIAVDRPEHYGKWSCVRSPYNEPRYALPYGFIQSPILASLVLDRSVAGALLRELSGRMSVCVYMDDISLSSDDPGELQASYEALKEVLVEANLSVNQGKDQPPTDQINLFNCNLAYGEASVSAARRAVFLEKDPSPFSLNSFERYCASVERGNL